MHLNCYEIFLKFSFHDCTKLKLNKKHKGAVINFFNLLKIVQINISLVVELMVGPKKQDFWPKINILKGIQCILRIQGALVRQKLGMILENKVDQKLKLEKKITKIVT